MGTANDSSTIVLSKRLKHELETFKQYDRETYADVIGRLLHIAREDDESKMELSEETKKGIARAKEDFKKGRIYTSEQMRKELGLWMPYLLVWSDEIKANFAKLEKETSRRIYQKIMWANENNFLLLEKVENSTDYKYRVGDYRVFFAKIDENQYLVMRMDHRRNAYKKWARGPFRLAAANCGISQSDIPA